MADEEPGVDRDLPVEPVEELAEAVPLPDGPFWSASIGIPSTRAIMRWV